MFCPFCGTKVPNGINQCPRCKKSFRVEAEKPKPAQGVPLAPTPKGMGQEFRGPAFLYAKGEARPNAAAVPSARGTKLWKWGLVAVVGVYLILILALTIAAIRGGLTERHRLQEGAGLPPRAEYLARQQDRPSPTLSPRGGL